MSTSRSRASQSAAKPSLYPPKRRQDLLVYADTGEMCDLQGEALDNARKNKTVIKASSYKVRQSIRRLVYAATGELCEDLQGDALAAAREKKEVITESAYRSRKGILKKKGIFVYEETGEICKDLEGEALQQARTNKEVITLTAYNLRQWRLKKKNQENAEQIANGSATEQSTAKKRKRKSTASKYGQPYIKWVYAANGKRCYLEGEKLEQAKCAEVVITVKDYKMRQRCQKFVYADGGAICELEGKALEEAKQKKEVLSKNAYYLRKLRKAKKNVIPAENDSSKDIPLQDSDVSGDLVLPNQDTESASNETTEFATDIDSWHYFLESDTESSTAFSSENIEQKVQPCRTDFTAADLGENADPVLQALEMLNNEFFIAESQSETTSEQASTSAMLAIADEEPEQTAEESTNDLPAIVWSPKDFLGQKSQWSPTLWSPKAIETQQLTTEENVDPVLIALEMFIPRPE